MGGPSSSAEMSSSVSTAGSDDLDPYKCWFTNRTSDVLSVGEEITVRVVSVDPGAERISLSRLDPRGAVLGSEEAVDSDEIDQALSKPDAKGLSTNLGDLFKNAMKKND